MGANDQIMWVNREWVRTTGWTLDAMHGHEMMAVFYPDPRCRQIAVDHLQLAAPGVA